MIKFTADGIVGFGLTPRNLRGLREGRPIEIDLEEMGLSGKAVIFFGESEMQMCADLKAAGLIGEDTEIHDLRDGQVDHPFRHVPNA